MLALSTLTALVMAKTTGSSPQPPIPPQIQPIVEGASLGPNRGLIFEVKNSPPTKADIIALLYSWAFAKEVDFNTAYDIVDLETGGTFNPLAKNPNSTAKGLFQIIDGTWKYGGCEGDPYDPENNIVCGLNLLKKDGIGHWLADPKMRQWLTERGY